MAREFSIDTDALEEDIRDSVIVEMRSDLRGAAKEMLSEFTEELQGLKKDYWFVVIVCSISIGLMALFGFNMNKQERRINDLLELNLELREKLRLAEQDMEYINEDIDYVYESENLGLRAEKREWMLQHPAPTPTAVPTSTPMPAPTATPITN